MTGVGARRLCSLVLFVGSTLLASRAEAQNSGALAESLFREGRDLFERGQAELACEKFAESLRLDPALGTLLNLAECHAHVGRTASAWARFQELEEKARRAGQKDREAYAREKVAELEAKLVYVRLRFSGSAVVDRVTIDEQPIGRTSFASALPLDPGSHRLEYWSGGRGHELTFEAPRSAGTHVVDVPALESHAASSDLPSSSPPPLPAASGTSSSIDPRSVVGWVGIGLAGVGVGLGTYFGVRAISLRDESDARCDDAGCDAEGLALFQEARDHAHGATVSFAISGAALITGATLLIVVATDAPSVSGVSVVGRF